MEIFCVGDIHGHYLPLVDALDQSDFDEQKDLLIALGDYCDRGDHTPDVIDHLSKLPNFIGIRGNHDFWLQDYLRNGKVSTIWMVNGGHSTVESYKGIGEKTKKEHLYFLESLKPYHIMDVDGDNYAFTHGGWTELNGLGYEEYDSVYAWDRTLFENAMNSSTKVKAEMCIRHYDKVFIGHTPTINFYESGEPILKLKKLWNLDTGVCYKGKLTVMNVKTNEYFQSLNSNLYYGKN